MKEGCKLQADLTSVHDWVFRQCNASRLCKERSHSDTLGLQLLIENIQLVSRYCVGHSKLWYLNSSQAQQNGLLCISNMQIRIREGIFSFIA